MKKNIKVKKDGKVRNGFEVLKFLDKEQLIVAPDCGLGHLPRELAKKKLKIMVEAAKSF